MNITNVQMKGNIMKKVILFIFLAIISIAFSSCKKNDKVIIYTNVEDFRIQKIDSLLKEKYPDINVVIQYYSTGTLAAKVKAEGKDIEADIILGVDIANATVLLDNFAELKDYDTTKYLDEMVYSHNKFHVWSKEAGCIILNTKVLAEKGLPEPTSYNDLLDMKYKDLIMMPNPKSSGTGYFFYNSLVANRGENKAIEYFKSLNKIVKSFSESGSGPVKALDKGEIAIGLGMTFQAVQYAENNNDLKIIFFEEGSPYNLYTSAITKGKENRQDVQTIYRYLYDEYFLLDKDLYNPEVIYKNQKINMPGYPQDIKYSKMEKIEDYSYKESLLDKWTW